MRQREADLAALWSAGAWRGRTLRSLSGTAYTVLYEGRRGGGAGPDFRDAVLAHQDGRRIYGDVELHVRTGGWREHGHTTDPRYNGVVLHAVLKVTGGERETLLASGGTAPVVVLRPHDVASGPDAGAQATEWDMWTWPCAPLADTARRAELRALLEAAGQARFEAQVEALCAELRAAQATEAMARCDIWTPADRVLWTALAEGLGYGRDRSALRHLGVRLAQGMPPEKAMEWSARLGWIERKRVAGLVVLWRRWRDQGPWVALRRALAAKDAPERCRALVAALRVEERGAVSRGRALILATNAALPFAAACARLEADAGLESRARELYATLAGLPSNGITRTMRRQLGMARLPERARAHQGLHHIWVTHCREKRCAGCPCAVSGRPELSSWSGSTKHTSGYSSFRGAGT